MNTNEQSYNGWTNYETWNVALWIQNHETLYKFAILSEDYRQFAELMREFGYRKTGDGVAWNSRKLNRTELDELIRECE